MSVNSTNRSSNLAMLQLVAHRLGDLNEKLVYLGGCTTALFITDPVALDVRSTIDVDCIVDVFSQIEYHKLTKALQEKGFVQSAQDELIIRWRYDDIILDVVPIDEKILGFSNRWYKEAFANAVAYQLTEKLTIKSLIPAYFLATKLEAFKDRGNNDFYMSHDLEDIIMVISGRAEIIDDIRSISFLLQSYLKENFVELLANEQFLLALPGHLNDGPHSVTIQRVDIVINRLKTITEN